MREIEDRELGQGELNIRYATLDEIDLIADMGKDAIIYSLPKRKMWLASYAKRARREELLTLKTHYRFAKSNIKVLVAELELEGKRRQIAGYLIMMLGVKDSSSGYPHAWIVDLYVREEFRRQGIARELMRVAENIAKRHGYRYIGLTVTSENTPAMNLYLSLGYLEERKIMVKDLKSDERTSGKDERDAS